MSQRHHFRKITTSSDPIVGMGVLYLLGNFKNQNYFHSNPLSLFVILCNMATYFAAVFFLQKILPAYLLIHTAVTPYEYEGAE